MDLPELPPPPAAFNRRYLNQQLLASPEATVPFHQVDELWIPILDDPGCLKTRCDWIMQYRARQGAWNLVSQQGGFGQGDAQRLRQRDRQQTNRGQLASQAQVFHMLHRKSLTTALLSTEEYEEQAKTQVMLAGLRNGLVSLNAVKNTTLPKVFTPEDVMVFQSLTSLAGAFHSIMKSRMSKSNMGQEPDALGRDGITREMVAAGYRSSVVWLIVLRKCISRFQQHPNI
ncbi:ulp1 protease family protein [Colletotrichum tofieldiae]|nr:ulp1 protease family protein [Colletotrichum tofieldiae]